MTTYLHSLPSQTEFTYKGNLYRTIMPIRDKVVCKCRHKKRDVLNLKTSKVERLPYFSLVTNVSENSERKIK